MGGFKTGQVANLASMYVSVCLSVCVHLIDHFSVYVGVLQNIMLELPDHSRAVHLIVDTLTTALDVSPEHIICSLANFCNGESGTVVPAFAQVSLWLAMHAS